MRMVPLLLVSMLTSWVLAAPPPAAQDDAVPARVAATPADAAGDLLPPAAVPPAPPPPAADAPIPPPPPPPAMEPPPAATVPAAEAPPADATPTEVPPRITVREPAEAVRTPQAGTNQAAAGVEKVEQPAEPQRGEMTVSKAPEIGRIPISVTLDDVPLADVVRMFTRISGANIIAVASNLTGTVTVNLTEVDWKDALDAILAMHNLALTEQPPGSKVYSIVERKPGAEPLVVETVFLRYATVDDVGKVVNSMIKKPEGILSPFPHRNALVIKTTQNNLSEIKQIIATIDRMREQVVVEAKFMELNKASAKNIGVNWEVLREYGIGLRSVEWQREEKRTSTLNREDTIEDTDSRRRRDEVNKAFDASGKALGLPPTDPISDDPAGGQQVLPRRVFDRIEQKREATGKVTDMFDKVLTDTRTAVLSAAQLNVILSALVEAGVGTLVSRPRIVVANEQPAVIHIGSVRRPFVSMVTPQAPPLPSLVTYNPGDPIEEGVKVTVTPTVNTASNITLKIEPELSRILDDEWEEVPETGQRYPTISRKKLTTVFCIESGKTVAIAGLTQTEEGDKSSKIPLLGDIPLIGKYLFTHSSKNKGQDETVIFVTVALAPPGMKDDTGMPDGSQLTRMQLIRDESERRAQEAELNELRKASDPAAAPKPGSREVRSRLLGLWR